MKANKVTVKITICTNVKEIVVIYPNDELTSIPNGLEGWAFGVFLSLFRFGSRVISLRMIFLDISACFLFRGDGVTTAISSFTISVD